MKSFCLEVTTKPPVNSSRFKKVFIEAILDFLKITLMQTVKDPKSLTLELLAQNIFTCSQLSQKHI